MTCPRSSIVVIAATLLVAAGAASAAPKPRELDKASKPPTVDLKLPTSAQPAVVKPSAPKPAETRCEGCHVIEGWDDVRFDHAKTEFALKGNHRRVTCKACHPIDFVVRIPDQCVGCHRDPHAAEFGARCEGCHDERSWRTSFNVDAHRRTNFPLSGRHALIPCVECHPNVRDRVFSRSPVTCVTCHLADFQAAATRSLDHVAAGFSQDCRGCHTTFRWTPARFPQHDQCFQISGGAHLGLRCLSCHTTLPTLTGAVGACMTNNAACSSCHEHNCAKSDSQHGGVPGYQCKDRKCYSCHRFSGGP